MPISQAMAVPRPLLLTLLGTLLLAATFFATRNAREQVAEEPPPVQQAEAVNSQPEPAEKSKPRVDKTREAGADKKSQGADVNKSQGADAKKSEAADRPRRAEPPQRRAEPRRRRAAQPSVAAAVKRAVMGDRLVVLFFYARGASDDRRVARSVAALRGRTKAAVFSDRIGNLGKYGQIATSVGVTRSPSIVIIGKGNRGRLIEGYVDPGTLAQRVADAR
jgi:hypothetical protein